MMRDDFAKGQLDPWGPCAGLELYIADPQFDRYLTRVQRRAMRSLRKLATRKTEAKQRWRRAKSDHPRLRSNSAISRYSRRRHGTALETYDRQEVGSFFVASYLAPRWLADVMYHVRQERWGRWVTIGTRPIGGPAAIKRSRMKSRQRMRDPILERRNFALSLEIRRRETSWQREDRDMYLGRDGARNVHFDEDLDDYYDDRGWDDDCWDDDPPASDSQILACATYDVLRIAEAEAPHLAGLLSRFLEELAQVIAEPESIGDRPLRWQLMDSLGIRGMVKLGICGPLRGGE